MDLCIDDHGSLVIFRSVSVRPKHLSDQNFDHDYFFKLPLQGAGCPTKWTVFYFTPCPVPSCPTYKPNSIDGEYSQLFLPAFPQLAFVDQEGPKSGTAFTLENVRWHSIPS